MKLGKYLRALNKLAKEHPEALNYEMIYATDKEGSSFEVLFNFPSIGELQDTEFIQPADVESGEEYKPNVVCVN